MPYNPNFPQDNERIDAAPFREQFQSIKALIDANAGGGGGITDVVIDGVTTLSSGSPATVSASVSAGVLHLQFGIPQGSEGQQGQDGATGGQGPPFATVIIDAVITLPAGSAATVVATFDGTNVHLTIGLPQGNDGAQGEQGVQGEPGEVTGAQLDAAISSTSSNTNAVSTLDTAFTNDPPSLADLELMRAKYNELVLALRR